jgi:hypothetical protein
MPGLYSYATSSKAVTLLEAVHTPASIHELLFPRKERMTLGTDFNPQILFYRAGLEGFAASACDSRFAIVGMYILLHFAFTSFARS